MKCRITALQNGPLRLETEGQILLKDGSVVETDKSVLLCTCGQSGTKPFCDFTHVAEGFTSDREIDSEILHRWV